jgi:hypothetical protein
MGYDFGFARLVRGPERFPSKLPHGFGEKDLNGFGDLVELARLVSTLGFLPLPKIANEFGWDTPDGGSIYFGLRSASTGWIYVDTHAHWRFVLAAYTRLQEQFPDLAILDMQTAILHDAASFSAFIDASYQRRRADQ